MPFRQEHSHSESTGKVLMLRKPENTGEDSWIQRLPSQVDIDFLDSPRRQGKSNSMHAVAIGGVYASHASPHLLLLSTSTFSHIHQTSSTLKHSSFHTALGSLIRFPLTHYPYFCLNLSVDTPPYCNATYFNLQERCLRRDEGPYGSPGLRPLCPYSGPGLFSPSRARSCQRK